MWWPYQVAAAVVVASINSMFRHYGMNYKTMIISMVVIAAAQILYAKSYTQAPSFIQPWFIGTASLAICGLLSSIILFDGVIGMRHYTGIIFILSGAYMLMGKVL